MRFSDSGDGRVKARRGRTLLAFLCLAVGGCGRDLPIGQVVSWETASPASQGVDGSTLDAAGAELATKGTHAFLVIRNNRIVHEWYAWGHGSWRLESVASLSKSLVGGVVLMLTVAEGDLGLDDTAASYIPYWADDSLKSRITIRQLATHASGLEHGARGPLRILRRSYQLGNAKLFSKTLGDARVSFEPGTAYQYSGVGYGALSYALAAARRDAREPDVLRLLRTRVMQPIGVPNSAWSIGYGEPLEIDGMHVHAVWSGGRYTARAIARVGQLMLQKGRWEGRQLIDSALVEDLIGYRGAPAPDPSQMPATHPAASVCWWTNALGAWPELPLDAFAGLGAGGQLLLVVPSLELVVVRVGEMPGATTMPDLWQAMHALIFKRVAAAVLGSGEPVSPSR